MSLEDTREDEISRVADGPARDAQETALVSIEATVPTVETLIAKAVEHQISVEGLEKLLAMHERMESTAAKRSYMEALSAFQANCPVVPKTKTASGSGSYSYKYAPLDVIVSTVAPLLRRHGLSYRFDTAFEATEQGQAQVVRCIVQHRDGHSESSEFRTPIDAGARMNDMQKSASAQTYAKRYAFCNALGILTGDEDDDGRGSTGPDSGRRSAPRPVVRDSGDGAPHPATVASTSSGGQAGGATPRPLGRNLVRIPRPSQEPQGSDGASTSLSSSAPAVAETPAAPESTANDAAKAELRMSLIRDWAKLLRATGKFDGMDDESMWQKATDVLSAQCEMQYKRPLHEMNLEALRHARQKTNETLAQKGVAAA